MTIYELAGRLLTAPDRRPSWPWRLAKGAITVATFCFIYVWYVRSTYGH